MLLGFAGLGYAFRRSRRQALASAPVLPRRPFFGGPGRLPPIAMAGPAQEGFGGPKDPQASPLSAWMLTQARWATHGDAVRVCSLSGAEAFGTVGAAITDVGAGGSLKPSDGTATVDTMRASATLSRRESRAIDRRLRMMG